MSFSATAFRLLVSAPSDVPDEDIASVVASVNRWNALNSRAHGVVVVPVHWRSHAAAAHGNRPQATINTQLVQTADIVIAMFWSRLGSPTGEAISGTVEEIDEAHDAGAYVAVFQCERSFPSSVDLDQLKALRGYIDDVCERSLISTYASSAALATQIDTTLTWAVSQRVTQARSDAEAPASAASVWPRVETDSRVSTDQRGRTQTKRSHRLVLANLGGSPAQDVHFRLEAERSDDHLPLLLENERPLETLSPGGEASYPLVYHGGIAPQARCVVSWDDQTGARQNQATLRFF